MIFLAMTVLCFTLSYRGSCWIILFWYVSSPCLFEVLAICYFVFPDSFSYLSFAPSLTEFQLFCRLTLNRRSAFEHELTVTASHCRINAREFSGVFSADIHTARPEQNNFSNIGIAVPMTLITQGQIVNV